MPRGQFRSRRFRRVFVRTPGSRTVIHYKDRKPGKTRCGKCKKVLAGVPHQKSSIIKNLSKSSKRPSRPYGGVYCDQCTRLLLKLKARQA